MATPGKGVLGVEYPGNNASRTSRNRARIMQGKEYSRRGRQRQAGFTIVEIMVVVVIIGMLATVVVANLFGEVDTAKLTKVKSDIDGLKSASKRYKLRFGSWPESIDNLVNPDEGDYFIEEEPKDPWDNEYQFEGTTDRGDLMIRCAGDDKEFDTDDDITTENYRSLKVLPKLDKGQ
jgi:general secretion pathway protein G